MNVHRYIHVGPYDIIFNQNLNSKHFLSSSFDSCPWFKCNFDSLMN